MIVKSGRQTDRRTDNEQTVDEKKYSHSETVWTESMTPCAGDQIVYSSPCASCVGISILHTTCTNI